MLQTIQHLPEDRRPPMPIQHSRSSQDGDCYISHTSYIISALPTAPAGHHVSRLTSDPFMESWGRYAPVKQELRDENDATTLGSKELRDMSTRLSSSSVKTQRRTSTAHLHVPGQGHLGLHVGGAWGLRHHPYGGRREVTLAHPEVTHLNPYSQQEIRRSPDCYPDMTESPVQTLNVPQFTGQYDSGGQQHPSPPDRCPQSQSSPYLHRSMSDDDESGQDDNDYSDNTSGSMHNSKISNDDGDDGPTNLETRNGFRFSAPQSALSPVGSVSQPRAKREFVPDHKKDATYWNKRLKNNDSARRSRIKRKTMEKIMEHRMAELQKENLELRYELNALKRMLGDQLTSDLKPPKPSSSLMASSPSSSSSSSSSLSSNSPFCLLTASSESGYEDHSNSSSAMEAAEESGTKHNGYNSPVPVSPQAPAVTKGMSTSPSFPDEIEFSKKSVAVDETMIYRPPLQGRGFSNQTGSGRNQEIVPNTSPFLSVERVHDVTINRSSMSDSGTDSSPSRSPCSSEGSPDSSSSNSSSSNSSSSSSSSNSSNSSNSSSGLFQTNEEKGSRGILGNTKSWEKCVDIDLLQKIPLKFRIKRGLQPIATDSQLSRDDLK